MKLLVSGLVVHLIFLASLFDVYFNSPVIQGIKAFEPTYFPAADRLILIVADGLRARSFFSNQNNASPYLRHIIENKGSWGVSHTRVPTESRPGHVALIAGLYEDPSAVTKGWKENPVEFDSVFNRSRHTWAWGSRDILPMFSKGEASGRVTTYCYPRSMQKFSGDGSNEKLDTWVLDRTLSFFNSFNKSHDNKSIHEPGIIFFLHLLGTDTAGHATKPHSRQYIDNIKLVDSGVKRIEEAVEQFYGNDGRTAYIFTSDHGMTDWGSHGAGLADETETPLVVWGSGLSGPQIITSSDTSVSPDDWGLGHLRRRDVKQADLAALMSALLALPTPTNNVGLIPRSLLAKESSWVAQAVLSNAHQLFLQFKRSQELVHERLLSLFLRPYPHLSQLSLDEAEIMDARGDHDASIEIAERVSLLALEGIQYYQDYFSHGLKWTITAAHLLWLVFLAKSLLIYESSCTYSRIPLATLSSVIFLICGLVLVQSLPIQFVVYYSLPCVLLWAIGMDCQSWWPSFTLILKNNLLPLLFTSVISLLAIALLVSSFFYRELLSIGLLMLSLWPVIENKCGNSIPTKLILLWALCCLCAAVFPQLPVVGKLANYNLVLGSGFVVLVLGLGATWFIHQRAYVRCRDTVLLTLQAAIAAVAAVNVYYTSINFESGLGLTMHNQAISWIIFVVSALLPGFLSDHVGTRLTSAWLSLASVLALLSVRHELLFLLLLVLAMAISSAIELHLVGSQLETCIILLQSYSKISVQSSEASTIISLGDLRRAYFYLFFTVLAFFGLGNVASLNSFDPSWVRCLITTFSPEIMGLLILLKTVAPFLAVACGVYTVALLTQRPVQWTLVLGLCDAMSLPFFHLIVTSGSWLDVGQSISHFVIAHACVLLLLLLHSAAHHWLNLSWPCVSQLTPSTSLETPCMYNKDHGE